MQASSSFERGLLSSCSVWGYLSWWFLLLHSKGSKHMGFVAPQRVKPLQTRAWSCVPSIGRWILNHWTTREAHYELTDTQVGLMGNSCDYFLMSPSPWKSDKKSRGQMDSWGRIFGERMLKSQLELIVNQNITDFWKVCEEVFSSRVSENVLLRFPNENHLEKKADSCPHLQELKCGSFQVGPRILLP